MYKFLRTIAALVVVALVLSGCVDSSRSGGNGGAGDSAVSDGGDGSGGDDGDSGDGGGSSTSDPEFDDAAMLTNLADAIFIPNYESLVVATEEFSSATGSLADYCASIGTPSESEYLVAAQSGWRSAMAVAQATEMHAIGPAAANGSALRNRVLSYSAGAISTCGIDEIVVIADDAGFNIVDRAINQRGLGAIEYLLFNENLDHTCPPQVPTTEAWNTLDDDTRQAGRCLAAQIIADDTATAAVQIRDQWIESGGNFRSDYIAEESIGNNLQSTSDALFYTEIGVKDAKLGIPLGIIDACSNISCPDSVESKYSQNSLANIRTNLVAFLEIFQGAESLGFDDFIADEGFSEVNLQFANNVEAAVAAIDAVTTPLYDQAMAIETETQNTQCTNAYANPDTFDEDFSACTVYGLIKRITDSLKIDFVTIVGVQLPDGAQADND